MNRRSRRYHRIIEMAEASFEYWFMAYNWVDGTQEIAVSWPRVTKARIEKLTVHEEWREANLTLRLDLFLCGVASYEEARHASDEFAEKVLAVAAFAGEGFVTDIHFNSGVFEGRMMEGTGRIGGASNTVMSVNRPAMPRLAGDLETHLGRCDGPAERYYVMFRAAMQADAIGRYLLLYLILLTHFNDRQQDVDDFVRGAEPGVVETLMPLKAHRSEMVYTRLRNAVGHRRVGASHVSTRAEMAERTPALVSLVKKMMDVP